MKKFKYKRGDVVKVWSLQSFSDGGFINGREGIVSQDQGNGTSVLVAVERKINGKNKIDPSYEVYPQQLKLVKRPKKDSLRMRFMCLLEELKDDEAKNG